MMLVLPIIMIIALLLLIAVIIRSSKNKYKFWNKGKWVLSTYVIVLIISSSVYFILPKDMFLSKENEVQENLKNIDSHQIYDQLYSDVIEGHSADIDDRFVVEQWQVAFEGSQLSVSDADGNYIEATVMIDRKEVNDGKIDVASYAVPTIIENIDFSARTSRSQLDFVGNELSVINPRRTDIHIAKFTHAYPITQFTNVEQTKESRSLGMAMGGEEIIYLKVPKDLEVTGDEFMMIEDYIDNED